MKISRILSFLQKRVKVLGVRLVYSVLLMKYAYQSDRTPKWAKRIILGAIAYLLSPIDSIPDLTPVLGFTDDLGIISFALVSIACYIDSEIRLKAKEKLHHLIKDVNENDLMAVDAKL